MPAPPGSRSKRAVQAHFRRRAEIDQLQKGLAERELARRIARFQEELREPGPALAEVRAADAVSMLEAAPAKRRILAEGDSWFSYPDPLIGSVIDHLRGMVSGTASILNLAFPGDEVRQMLGRVQAQRLVECLTSPKLGPFDALLFSGGGNDIVGDQLALLLNPRTNGTLATGALIQKRVDAILGWVLAGYDELIQIRNKCAPETWILLNAYDFPPVTGKKACLLGPWLKPSLEARDWIERTDQDAIVRDLLQRFAQRLQALAAGARNVTVVPTQGTLSAAEWDNEIHPNDAGFRKIAERFFAALPDHLH